MCICVCVTSDRNRNMEFIVPKNSWYWVKEGKHDQNCCLKWSLKKKKSTLIAIEEVAAGATVLTFLSPPCCSNPIYPGCASSFNNPSSRQRTLFIFGISVLWSHGHSISSTSVTLNQQLLIVYYQHQNLFYCYKLKS